jgi:hypothetical protein
VTLPAAERLAIIEVITRADDAASRIWSASALTDPDHPVIVTHGLAVSSRKQPRSPAKPA